MPRKLSGRDRPARPARPARRPGRAARPPRSPWWRVAGYGGALLLVAAAVAVLLLPVLNRDGGARRAAATPGPGQAAATTAPGYPGADPNNPIQQQPTQPSPGTSQNTAAPPGTGGVGGTMPDPTQTGGGTSADLCDQSTAIYRPSASGGVDVVVTLQNSSAVAVQLTLTAGEPQAKQDTVLKGVPHTFSFAAPVTTVQRVKVTALAVGSPMKSCYARPGA
ncbi:hypothetical protein [Actinomadura atramentaria]|uniref:hypothetical protein n=1 Tax=Actinomadura atramentaria TaxID=1990 RepID=UPI00037525F9|nr:hypothetical protein [Actinomadura atramentaria]